MAAVAVMLRAATTTQTRFLIYAESASYQGANYPRTANPPGGTQTFSGLPPDPAGPALPFFRPMHKTHTFEVSAPAFLTLAMKTVLKVLGCYSTDKHLFYNSFPITPFIVQA
ncbi:hypothetical protein AD946_07955 [Gluconobacter thailandicus]|nr:hypothetical protein AD946_07955 [Gluconobacter thailandicus]